MQRDFKYRIGLKASSWQARGLRQRRWFRLSFVIAALFGVALVVKWLWPEEHSSSVQVDSRPQPTKEGEAYSAIPLKVPSSRLEVPVRALSSELPYPQFSPVTEKPLSPRKQVFTIERGQNLSVIFSKLGLRAKVLQEILQVSQARSVFAKLKPGQKLEFFWDLQGNFEGMQFPATELESLKIRYENGRAKIESQKAALAKTVQYRAGTINSSLYWAGHKAGLSDKLVLQLAEIFAWDIDFILDVKPGDSFYVLYESLHSEGKKIRDGDILAAEFINQGTPYRAVRYANSKGESSYYTPAGMSLKKAFIRTPVAFSTISSQFNLARKHPVLNIIRAHKGVDYRAPIGTAVKAAGDGRIVFAGRKGGYGNTLILDHGQQMKTLYAHLLKFRKGISVGKRIRQSETIGFVGRTGLATGPHLHYEFQVRGTHKNPVTVSLPRAQAILKAEKPNFLVYTKPLLARLESYKYGYAGLASRESRRQ